MWCGPSMFIFTKIVFEFCFTYVIFCYFIYFTSFIYFISFISPTFPILYHYLCYESIISE